MLLTQPLHVQPVLALVAFVVMGLGVFTADATRLGDQQAGNDRVPNGVARSDLQRVGVSVPLACGPASRRLEVALASAADARRSVTRSVSRAVYLRALGLHHRQGIASLGVGAMRRLHLRDLSVRANASVLLCTPNGVGAPGFRGVPITLSALGTLNVPPALESHLKRPVAATLGASLHGADCSTSAPESEPYA